MILKTRTTCHGVFPSTNRSLKVLHIVQEKDGRVLRHGQQLLHLRTAAKSVEHAPQGLSLSLMSSPHLVVHGAVLHQHVVREVHQPPHAPLAHHRASDDVLTRPGDQLLQPLRVHHPTVPQRALHREQHAAKHQVVLAGNVVGAARMVPRRAQPRSQHALNRGADGAERAVVVLHAAHHVSEGGVFDEVDVRRVPLGVDAEPTPGCEVCAAQRATRPHVVKPLHVRRELDGELVLLSRLRLLSSCSKEQT